MIGSVLDGALGPLVPHASWRTWPFPTRCQHVQQQQAGNFQINSLPILVEIKRFNSSWSVINFSRNQIYKGSRSMMMKSSFCTAALTLWRLPSPGRLPLLFVAKAFLYLQKYLIVFCIIYNKMYYFFNFLIFKDLGRKGVLFLVTQQLKTLRFLFALFKLANIEIEWQLNQARGLICGFRIYTICNWMSTIKIQWWIFQTTVYIHQTKFVPEWSQVRWITGSPFQRLYVIQKI